MAKLKDLGRKKSKSTYQKRAQATAQKGYRRFDAELRLKEKAANERMRQLEKAGIKSPAYQSVQAMLEILGKQTKGPRGRRFSETGKATYSERELLNKILNEFLYEQKTSTLAGAREYMDTVWSEANKNNKLAAAGITRDEWLDFWESMPDRKDRLYGSSENVAILRAYTIKKNEIQNMSEMQRQNLVKKGKLTEKELQRFADDLYTPEDIAAEIKASDDLKSAWKALGLTPSEIKAAKIKTKGKKRK